MAWYGAGREELVEAIVARVQQLVEQRKGGLVLIEGDPGEGPLLASCAMGGGCIMDAAASD